MTAPATPFDNRFASLEAGEIPGARQIALVPGAAVPLVTLDLPKALSGQAREQVARRQIQDIMGLAPDQIEMRPNLHSPDWQTAVLAAPDQLAQWRQKASKARAILPDYMALPTSENLWTVAGTHSGVAVRLGPNDGFGAGADVALAQLAALLDHVPATKPAVILHLGQTIDGLASLAEHHDIPLVTDIKQVAKAGGIDAPKVLGHRETECDLLRDPGLVRTRLRRSLRAWSVPLFLGALGAGLWATANITETRQLTEETQAITDATAEIVRAHFVPNGPILDIRQQVSRALDEARGQTYEGKVALSAFDLFAQSSTSLAQSGAQLIEVSSDNGQRLDVTVDVVDFTAADTLLASLRTNALTAELIESRATGQGSTVRARFRLTSEGEK